MKSNTSHECIGNTSTNIIRVVQKIELTTSTDRTTSTPEKLGETIEKMSHDIPTIYLGFSNVLF